jgi:hypothetical protein
VVERPIEVGTPMSARLVGDDFDIQPVEAVPCVLGSTRPAEWSWTIRPQSSGKKELRLELAVLLDEDSSTPIAVRRYVEVINVRVHLVNTSVRIATSTVGALGAAGLTVAALVGAAWSGGAVASPRAVPASRPVRTQPVARKHTRRDPRPPHDVKGRQGRRR